MVPQIYGRFLRCSTRQYDRFFRAVGAATGTASTTTVTTPLPFHTPLCQRRGRLLLPVVYGQKSGQHLKPGSRQAPKISLRSIHIRCTELADSLQAQTKACKIAGCNTSELRNAGHAEVSGLCFLLHRKYPLYPQELLPNRHQKSAEGPGAHSMAFTPDRSRLSLEETQKIYLYIYIYTHTYAFKIHGVCSTV